ncbi:MAG: WhiB family transcriptional regulator [Actinomycetes bacterium]
MIELPPNWTERSACRDIRDPEIFFPLIPRGARATGAEAPAKAVCASCETQGECLDFALRTQSQGIWAGMNDEERREYVKSNPRKDIK